MADIIVPISFFVILSIPSIVVICLDWNKRKKHTKKEYDDEKNYWKDKCDELFEYSEKLNQFLRSEAASLLKVGDIFLLRTNIDIKYRINSIHKIYLYVDNQKRIKIILTTYDKRVLLKQPNLKNALKYSLTTHEFFTFVENIKKSTFNSEIENKRIEKIEEKLG